jgi:hypothetical protein
MSRLNFAALIPLLLVLAIIGYMLPWVKTPAQSLSMGAYDLSEWTSLHPVVRQTLPFLWVTLTLRVPLAIMGILLATYFGSTLHYNMIGLLLILVTAIALLPPLEFFTVYREDPNYQQQFFLALLTIVIGVIITIWRNRQLQRILPLLLSLLGCLSAAAGLYQAYQLMQGFDIPTSIGYGGLITVISLGITVLLYITKQSSQTTLFAGEIPTSRAV